MSVVTYKPHNKSTSLCTSSSVTSVSEHGKHIYKTNNTMRDISTVMEHPEFHSFFNKYFKNANDAQNIILLMKIYESIPKEDPYEKIAVLFEAMSNSELRHKLVDNFLQWRDKNLSGNILDVKEHQKTKNIKCD